MFSSRFSPSWKWIFPSKMTQWIIIISSKFFSLSIIVFLFRESEFLIDNRETRNREIYIDVSNILLSIFILENDTYNYNLFKNCIPLVFLLRESEFLIDNRGTRDRARFSGGEWRGLPLIDLILGVAFVGRNQVTGSNGAALLHPSSVIQPSRFDIRIYALRIATHRTRFVWCHFIDRLFFFSLSLSSRSLFLFHHDGSPPSVLRTRVSLRD